MPRFPFSALAAGLALTVALAATMPAEAAGSQVRLETSSGVIVLALDAAKAPATVANFLAYVDAGHYDGTLFHRVIPGFMIQGGGFDRDFRQKETRKPIANEAGNGLKNLRGTIAMARTGDPHSATAQFFINSVDNAFLDHTAPNANGWGYAVFGRVTEGLEVVDAISQAKTGAQGGHQDVPVEPVVLLKAERAD